MTGDAGGESDSLQPDAAYYARASFIDDPDRRANHAMVALMDDAVGNITAALRAREMWGHTLLLWSSDNGGAVHLGGGANTYPLRGGYYNNWEGGIRVGRCPHRSCTRSWRASFTKRTGALPSNGSSAQPCAGMLLAIVSS